MKVAIIADLHYGVKKNDLTFMESQLRFFKNQFVPELKQKNIDTIVVCGDVFDSRQTINVQTENVVIDLFKNTLKDFTIHIIVGNHDMFHTNTTEVNSLKALDLLPNVTVYEQMTEIEFGGKSTLMLPWIVNYEDFDQIVLKRYKFCFAHLDIVGFDMGGHLSENGLTMMQVLEKFDHTFTGHYHTRINRENIDGQTVTYVGSPYQITRIDRNQERGYLVLDTDTEEYQWYNNTQSIRFNTFTYPNVDRNKVKGNVVDLHIPYDKQNETKQIYDLVKELDGLFPAYPVNTFNDEPPIGTDTVDMNVDTERFNILNMAKNYIDQLELTKITNEELYKALEELYDKFKGTDD